MIRRLYAWVRRVIAVLTATRARKIASAVVSLAVAAGGTVGGLAVTRTTPFAAPLTVVAPPHAIDCSFACPTPAKARAVGVTVAARYLTGSGKALSKNEAIAWQAAGVSVLLNYEASAGAALGGGDTGLAAGRAACAAVTALGVPKGLPIYYSVDFDVTSSQMLAVRAYIAGAGAACPGYPARAYGEYDVCQALKTWCWQTYAWSGGKISEYAVFRQYSNGHSLAGGTVDYDEVLDATHLGAWSKAAPKPPAKPAVKKTLHRTWPKYAKSNYYGQITGPKASLGGASKSERADVKAIEKRINAFDTHNKIHLKIRVRTDGIYDNHTAKAIKKWQRYEHRKQTGHIHRADWNVLFTY